MDQEDFIPLKNGGAGVDFRGLVPRLIAEQPLDLLHGQAGALGHHLRRQFPNTPVALQVVFILAVGQSGLGQGLQLHRPVQPFGLGHMRHLLGPSYHSPSRFSTHILDSGEAAGYNHTDRKTLFTRRMEEI